MSREESEICFRSSIKRLFELSELSELVECSREKSGISGKEGFRSDDVVGGEKWYSDDCVLSLLLTQSDDDTFAPSTLVQLLLDEG